MQRHPTLCLAMLVRNESAIIARSLQSVRPLISHWIIFDTGEDPALQFVVQRTLSPLPGRIHRLPFSDFSDLRNRLLVEACQYGDFVLMIDADEILLESGNICTEMSGFTVGNIAVGDEQSRYSVPRLFSNQVLGKFTGAVYERFIDRDRDRDRVTNLISCNLFHAKNGYRYQHSESLKQDQAKLESVVSVDTPGGLDHFNLARLLIRRGQPAKAIQHLNKALNREELTGLHQWYTHYLLGLLAVEQNAQLDMITPHFARAYDKRPDKLEPLHQMVQLYMQSDELEQAYALSCVANEIFDYDKSFYYEPTVHNFESILMHIRLCLKLDKLDESEEFMRRAKGMDSLSLVATRELKTMSDEINRSWPITQSASGEDSGEDDTSVRLTIGMASYDDFDGTFFTIQSIYSYLSAELDVSYEFLIIDNNPRGEIAQALKQFAEIMPNTRYVAYDHIQGTAAAKNQVFVHAKGEIILCLDSHILLMPGSITALLEYFSSHPDTENLVQGPILINDHRLYFSCMADKWFNGFYGEWCIEDASESRQSEDREIKMQGMGAFACRKDAWPNFNTRFRGYGGEEGIIHEKFERLGRKTISLSGFVWLHRFSPPSLISYENLWKDRIRNLSIGFDETQMKGRGLIPHYTRLLGEKFTGPDIANVLVELNSPLYYFDLIYVLKNSKTEGQNEHSKLPPSLAIAHPVVICEDNMPRVQVDRPLIAHAQLLELAELNRIKTILVVDQPELFNEELLGKLKQGLKELDDQEWYRCYLGGIRLSGYFTPIPDATVLHETDGISRSIATAYSCKGFLHSADDYRKASKHSHKTQYDLEYPHREFVIPEENPPQPRSAHQGPAIRAYMITYQRDPQRLHNYQAINEKLSGFVEMAPAVDANNTNFDALCESGIKEGIFSSAYVDELKYNISGEVPRTLRGNIPVGKVGCKMSHFRLLKKLVTTHMDTEWFLIMEDDCALEEFDKDILTIVNDYCKHASVYGAGTIRLCVYPEFAKAQFNEELSLGEGLFKAIPQWGTCAYLISREGIRFVLDDLPTDLNTDNYFSSRLDQLKAVAVRSPFVTIGDYRPPNFLNAQAEEKEKEKDHAKESTDRLKSLIWQN